MCVKEGAFKYFTGNKSGARVAPSCRKLRQVDGYVKYWDGNNKFMNLIGSW